MLTPTSAREERSDVFGLFKKTDLPSAEEALPGRETPLPVAERHLVTGNALAGPYPEHLETAMFGMGCFWGVERLFWQQEGVWSSTPRTRTGDPTPTPRSPCAATASPARSPRAGCSGSPRENR